MVKVLSLKRIGMSIRNLIFSGDNISHASKKLLKVLLKRMENELEEEVSNTQAGFRKKRGTRDHIFNLRMIIQKYREINASLYTCFEQMWQTLKEMNFN